MITRARLEGIPLEEPQLDGRSVRERDTAAIVAAQAAGHVDPRWDPWELLILMFGIGMARAGWPQANPGNVDPDADAHAIGRASAVEAAARILAPRPE